ncbi:protein phosphatase 1 regulatory subunit 37, partial [Phenoliferia sp. Uapishka_3]
MSSSASEVRLDGQGDESVEVLAATPGPTTAAKDGAQVEAQEHESATSPDDDAPLALSNKLALPPIPPQAPSLDTPSIEEQRQLRPRTRKPAPRGILKPPTVQPSRFSFRRDILQPFNSRLAYAGYPAQTEPAKPGLAGAIVPPAAVAAVGNASAVVGGFWGSALKRLTVATNAAVAVAGGVPAQRQGSDDAGGSSSPIILTNELLQSAHHHGGDGSTSGAAPHTPSKGAPTALPATASPYATIRASPSTNPAVPPAPPPLSVTELKKVRFRMATLKVVYPINGPNGPLAPWEEGKTRKRINTEYRAMRNKSLEGGDSKGWTGEDLGRLYAECCRTREEPGIERVRRALRENPKAPPKSLDLSNELLSHGAIEALSDLLSVDFGLKKLTLESCGLDDESLKPLLHALLVSGSLPTLSLANNKRIKTKGWKLIAIFTRKARLLRYLDLSENSMDKKAAEYLVQALTPSTSLITLDATVPPLPLASPASTPLPISPSVSTSNYPETTPNRPHIEGLGIFDAEESAGDESDTPPPPPPETQYLDDEESEEDNPEPLFSVAPLLKESSSSTAATVLSIRLENCGLKSQALEALGLFTAFLLPALPTNSGITAAHGVRSSGLKHISIRRNRINALGAVAVAIMIRDFPVAGDHGSSTDSFLPSSPIAPAHSHSNGAFESSNSVTARQTLQAPYVRKTPASPKPGGSPRPSSPVPQKGDEESKDTPAPGAAAAQAEREAWKNSEARNRLRKQIEELPRTGSLLTLDVKGNDIRNGVTYIAQVLKRNRTLKVLNLSENKIDIQGLVSIAEALKFNSTLETLDMSLNPCCGPGLEGITTLRAAITINSNLKRVFLNSTDLSSEGAIALAEFLPEATSLIHLDLTGNFDIDIAGVLALSVSVKMNNTLRCLDLNIPANDPDFARLSQEILQCCVRNTEIAQEESIARGNKIPIAAPILKSVVARDLKTRQENEERMKRNAESASKSKDDIILAAEECRIVLSDLLSFDVAAKAQGVIVAPSEVVRDLLSQAQLAEAQLSETVLASTPGERKERAVRLVDQLTALLDLAKGTYDSPKPPSLPPTTPPSLRQLSTPGRSNGQHLTSPISPSSEDHVSSPSFSIADSDDDEDDAASVASTGSPSPPTAETQLPSVPRIVIPGLESNSDGSPKSPMESQRRFLTQEEGEIFRRGTALETADDEELVDVSGEELRQELLVTDVARSPRPSIIAAEGRPDLDFLKEDT